MRSKTKYKLIDLMKSNKLAVHVLNKIKKMTSKDLSLDIINEVVFEKEDTTKSRINLVLPTLRKSKVFGGINTAVKLFEIVLKATNSDGRIIILNDEMNDEKWEYDISGFSRDNSHYNIYYLAETNHLAVREKDFFVFTSWRTIYTLNGIVEWYKNNYGNRDYKLIYMIQDYEPGFHAWSTEYVLAESTYRNQCDSIIAVFNSKQLYDFFKNKQYCFGIEYYFTPSLNGALKKELLGCNDLPKREKMILIYGRPSEYRNAFEIVRYSLKIWSSKYKKAREWKIVSLGEYFNELKLENNTIVAYGKVSLEEYAQCMLRAFAGISLMISPHPSYPPLEMSTFGVRTITNTFANKDLSGFNNNIISVNNCIPDEIANKLIEICEQYDDSSSNKNTIDFNESYLNDNSLVDVANRVVEQIQGMIG